MNEEQSTRLDAMIAQLKMINSQMEKVSAEHRSVVAWAAGAYLILDSLHRGRSLDIRELGEHLATVHPKVKRRSKGGA